MYDWRLRSLAIRTSLPILVEYFLTPLKGAIVSLGVRVASLLFFFPFFSCEYMLWQRTPFLEYCTVSTSFCKYIWAARERWRSKGMLFEPGVFDVVVACGWLLSSCQREIL